MVYSKISSPSTPAWGQSMKSLSIHLSFHLTRSMKKKPPQKHFTEKSLANTFKKGRLANKHMKRCSTLIRKCHSKPGDVTSHPLGWLCIKNQKVTNCGWRWRGWNPCAGISADANWYHQPGNRVWGGFSKNQKQKLPSEGNPTSGYLSKSESSFSEKGLLHLCSQQHHSQW